MPDNATASAIVRRAELPADTQDAALRVAALSLKLVKARAERKLATEALKARLENVAEWNEADGLATEIKNNTAEQRKEINELRKAARKAVKNSSEQQAADVAGVVVHGLANRIEAELSENGQMFLRFAGDV